MKVIYINNESTYQNIHLTVNKIYTVIKLINDWNIIRFSVVNDIGRRMLYSHKRFKVINNEQYCNHIGVL